MSSGRRGGCLITILRLLLVGVAVVYGVAALTSPWSFHIGGRWTPLLYWSGTGKLVTRSGTYPLYVSFFPASHIVRSGTNLSVHVGKQAIKNPLVEQENQRSRAQAVGTSQHNRGFLRHH